MRFLRTLYALLLLHTAAFAQSAITNGAGGPAPVYISSNWYNLLNYAAGGITAGAAVTSNTIYCAFGSTAATPFTFKSLAFQITTGSAGNHTQMAVYQVIGGTMYLIDSTASISTTGTGVVTQAPVNTTDTIPPFSVVGLCDNSDNSVVVFESVSGSGVNYTNFLGATATTGITNTPLYVEKTIAQTFNTWPSSISLASMSDSATKNVPNINLQSN